MGQLVSRDASDGSLRQLAEAGAERAQVYSTHDLRLVAIVPEAVKLAPILE
jgi:hypothetical protein